jgi:preprotein translocase subunit YajC
MQIIFLLALPVLMYFLLIRPQQRRVREQRELLAKVEEGDEVMTTGGIYGFVNAVQDDTIWLDIADGVEVRISRASIARRIPAGTNDADAPAVDAAPAADEHDEDDAAATEPDAAAGTDVVPPEVNGNGSGSKRAKDAPAQDTPKAGPEAER